MAFPLPAGLEETQRIEEASDQAIAGLEQAHPGQRILVTLDLALPGPDWLWGWAVSLFTSSLADWIASHLAGLRPWPELGDIIFRDSERTDVVYIAYLGSTGASSAGAAQVQPALGFIAWAAIAAALLILLPIGLAISTKIASLINPSAGRAFDSLFAILPLLVVVLALGIVQDLPFGRPREKTP